MNSGIGTVVMAHDLAIIVNTVRIRSKSPRDINCYISRVPQKAVLSTGILVPTYNLVRVIDAFGESPTDSRRINWDKVICSCVN